MTHFFITEVRLFPISSVYQQTETIYKNIIFFTYDTTCTKTKKYTTFCGQTLGLTW